MCPLREVEGEVKDGGEMTQAGPEWRRCRIKKLGGGKTTTALRLAVVTGEQGEGRGSPLAASLAH